MMKLVLQKSERGVYPPRAYGRHRSVSTDMVAGVYPPRAYGRHRSVSTDIVAGVYPPRAYGQSRCVSTEMREHARTEEECDDQ